MALFLRLAALFLALVCTHAFAAFPLAPGYYITTRGGTVQNLGPFSTPAAACDPWYSASSLASGWANNANRINRGYVTGTSYGAYGACSAGSASSSYVSSVITKENGCPPGSKKVGETCVCDPGLSEQVNGGVYSCQAPQDNYCENASQMWNSTLNDDRTLKPSGKLSKYSDGAVVCYDAAKGDGTGCKHWFTGKFSACENCTAEFDAPGEKWTTTGTSIGLTSKDDPRAGGDLSCSLKNPPDPGQEPTAEQPKPDERNCYKGTVNGVDVCIEAWTGNTEGKDHDITRGPDGSTTETTTDIKCNGDQCTLTETTTVKDPDGNTVRQGTTTRPGVSREGYCAKNPRSSVCGGVTDPSGATAGQGGDGGSGGGKGNGKGNGDADGDGTKDSFGGSCTAGFKCNGDAVMCAMAQEQHKRNCQLIETATEESKLYDSIKDLKGDQTDKLEGAETVDIGSLINTSDALGGGSCIGDLNVVVMGQSVSLPMSRVCPYLAMLGNILVAVSMLLAARIIVRG